LSGADQNQRAQELGSADVTIKIQEERLPC